MPVSRRRVLGLAGGAAALHLVLGGTSTSLLGSAAAQDAPPNRFAEIDNRVLWGA